MAMLSKCTNPPCPASFRHLAEGRLFRLEAGQTVGSPNAEATEYFWLCESCSAGMTLRLAQDGRVMPAGLREPLRNDLQVKLNSANQENGLFLRSVSFLHRSHPRKP